MQARKTLYLMSNFSNLDLVDRERLTSRLMTLIGKNHEIHQRGQKLLQPVVLLLAESRIEQGFDSADDPRGGQRRLRASVGKEFQSLGFEAAREVVHEFDTAPNRGGAGGPCLDDHRAGGVGFAAGEAEQGFERETNPVAPDVPALAGGDVDLLA